MKTRTKFAGGTHRTTEAPDDVASSPTPIPPADTSDELLNEVIRLAREPLVLDEEESSYNGEPMTPALKEAMADMPTLSEGAITAAFAAVASTHENATKAIREMLASAGEQRNGSRSDWLTAAALATLDKFAQRPEPPAPDIHVHTPKQDLHVTVEQPEFKPQITVEGAEIVVPEREVQVDVHVPEQPAPQVNVAAAIPDVVVQAAAAPAPIVNVTMPDSIRTIPAEVETVAERDADDLIVRSVTRPTGE